MASSLRPNWHRYSRQIAFAFCLLIPVGPPALSAEVTGAQWSRAELATLRSLRFKTSSRPGPIPSNKLASADRAAALGHRLFFDPRLSSTGTFSCASCHDPDNYFTDSASRSQTLRITKRHAPSIVGTAFSPWFYWDGSRDSQWAQALTPIERDNEMGLTRMEAARLLTSGDYKIPYRELFGEVPDFSDRSRFPAQASPRGSDDARKSWNAMTLEDRDRVNQVFTNIGKSLAAYERLLLPAPSRFDRYVDQVLAEDRQSPALLSDVEIAGLRLFISNRAMCTRCHNGPMFSNFGFHNTGVPQADPNDPDFGRAKGVGEVLDDEFNCLGPYSDAVPEQCVELNFVRKSGEELVAAFKVPSLRNVAATAPYMHAGQYKTLREVLEHYSRPPSRNIGHLELSILNLNENEIMALEAFLGTLTSEIAADPGWLEPPGDN